MRKRSLPSAGRFATSATFLIAFILLVAIANSRTRQQSETPDPAIERGQKQFVQACGFCHGPDATGARGPDLVRSLLVAHDVKGDLIGEVIRQGRPDKGMPAMNLSEEQERHSSVSARARGRSD